MLSVNGLLACRRGHQLGVVSIKRYRLAVSFLVNVKDDFVLFEPVVMYDRTKVRLNWLLNNNNEFK